MGIGALFGALFGMAAGGAGIALLGYTVGTMWVLGAMVGHAIESMLNRPKIDLNSMAQSPTYSMDALRNTTTQILPIPIVYGKNRVGGNIIQNVFTQSDKSEADMLVAIGLGEVQSITGLKADDIDLENIENNLDFNIRYQHSYGGGPGWPWPSSNKWIDCTYEEWLEYEEDKRRVVRASNGEPTPNPLEKMSFDKHYGTPNQAKDSRALGDLSYPNIAYVGLHLKANQYVSGSPTISTIVEGRKIWTPSGVRYSNNPIWEIYDLLTGTYWNPKKNRHEPVGLGLPVECIDLDSFMDAAQYCDELINGKPRYTCNIVLDTQKECIDHIQDILSTCSGWLTARDKITVGLDRPVSAACKDIGLNDIVAGSFSWWQASSDELFNRIIIDWVDPENHWEQTSTIFEVDSEITARGVVDKTISLLGISDAAQAARMGSYILACTQHIKNHCQFSLSLKNSDLEVGDVIAISHDVPGWNKKWFRICSITEEDDTFHLVCSEYSDDVYDGASMTMPEKGAYTVPVQVVKPSDVSNLTLVSSGEEDHLGIYRPSITAEWKNTSGYDAIYIWSSKSYNASTQEGEWQYIATLPSDTESYTLTGLSTGTYFIKVKTLNKYKLFSDGVLQSISVVGDSQAPGTVTNVDVTAMFGSAYLTWENPTDKDFDHVEIWKGGTESITDAALAVCAYGTSATLHIGALQTAYLWIRAVDMSSNASGFAGPYLVRTELETQEDIVTLLSNDETFAPLYNGEFDQRISENAQNIITNAQTAHQEIQEVATATTALSTQVQSNTDAIAAANTTLNTRIDGVQAAVTTEQNARISADNAITSDISAMTATLNGHTTDISNTNAAIVTEQNARIAADNAITSNVSTMQTTVNGHTTTITSHTSSINGLNGKYGVTINSNGHLTGWKMLGGSTSGSMVINVDNFAIGRNGAKIYPFVIGPVNGTQTVAIANGFIQDGAIVEAKIGNAAISNAKIKDGSVTSAKIANAAITNAKIADGTIQTAKIANAAIDTAKIKNLSVSTIKVANGAISNVYSSYTESPCGSMIDTVIQSVSVYSSGNRLAIMFNARIFNFTSEAKVRLFVDSNVVGVFSFGTNSGDSRITLATIIQPSTGNHTISVKTFGGSNGQYIERFLSTTELKK